MNKPEDRIQIAKSTLPHVMGSAILPFFTDFNEEVSGYRFWADGIQLGVWRSMDLSSLGWHSIVFARNGDTIRGEGADEQLAMENAYNRYLHLVSFGG